ncbi:LOW QUALITY PROTEIN: hypothetical protein RJ641_001392, partial [Dillenia turbinata]
MTITHSLLFYFHFLSHPPKLSALHTGCPHSHNGKTLLLVFYKAYFTSISSSLRVNNFTTIASLSEKSEDEVAEKLLDDDLIHRVVSSAKDANESLDVIAEIEAVVLFAFLIVVRLLTSALDRKNADLALSVFSAMRSSFDLGFDEDRTSVERWRWSSSDVSVYTLLVRGLAASLKVSDAIRVIAAVRRVGVSPSGEVPFGKVVRCPSCLVAIAVAQPQHGIQIVSCSECCYQYELASGDIVSIDSDEIRSRPLLGPLERTDLLLIQLIFLHKKGKEEVGPFKISPKSPNFYPGEPMCMTNHKDGRESQLLRAPRVNESLSLLNPSILFPTLPVLATRDAASGLIDPSLPQFISLAAVGSVAFGATLNTIVFPQLNKLPQISVDAIAIKQQHLSQYDAIQSWIKGLKEAAEKEVWMLARMSVGEQNFCCRGFFLQISSMIEIEVELDSDVLAAEAASNAENIFDKIQVMELEKLEERWGIKSEANDAVERLLSTEPISSDLIWTSECQSHNDGSQRQHNIPDESQASSKKNLKSAFL